MSSQKIYVITKAEPLKEEKYVGIRSTRKLAEKFLRDRFPNMRPYDDAFVSDKTESLLLFIREEELI